jgi:hypothetical protein
MTLTISCQTVVDAPVARVAITVYDAQTGEVLAAGTSDPTGTLRFASLPVRPVRVALRGSLPNGEALRHTRQDRRGIWINLPQRPWRMNLRIDTDGLVFPDLGAADAGAPDAEGATAIAHGTLPTIGAASTATIVPRSARIVPASTPTAAAAPTIAAPHGSGWGMLLALVATIGGVVWLLVRARS